MKWSNKKYFHNWDGKTFQYTAYSDEPTHMFRSEENKFNTEQDGKILAEAKEILHHYYNARKLSPKAILDTVKFCLENTHQIEKIQRGDKGSEYYEPDDMGLGD